MGGMAPSVVVEGHPTADPLARLATACEGMQIDALLLQGAPQSLDEDVVEKAAAPVHRDAHAGISQAPGPRPRSELAALIGVEDLGPSVGGDCLIERIDTELGIHGVRQPLICSPKAGSVLVFSASAYVADEERRTMKASRFTDAQKAFVVKQGEEGKWWRRSAGKPESAKQPISTGSGLPLLTGPVSMLVHGRLCHQAGRLA